MASNLGLYYLSMSHKKNASLIWVKFFCCINYSNQLYFSSSKRIMIGYRAVLTILIGMTFAICGTEPVTIKTVFFAMARIIVCFNLSFLDFKKIKKVIL